MPLAHTKPAAHHRLPASMVYLLVLLGLCVFVNYIDRGNLSIAAPLLSDELGLTPAKLGLLLSAFFWTYACLQPVYGWLVDRLNVYLVLAICFSFWSLATLATGFVGTFAALFVLRLAVGIGESVSYPAFSKIIALQFPEQHRGLANSVVAAGLFLGPAFGLLFGGTLMARFGWRPFFIGLGLISLFWLLPWLTWMRHATTPPAIDPARGPTLVEFVSHRSAWGSCIGLFSCNYVNYFMLTWLPYYLVRERQFSINSMARIGAAAYFVSACSSTASGWVSDLWVVSGKSPTVVRKAFAGGGLAISGVLFGLCAFASPSVSVAFLIAGMAFFGASGSNLFAISQRLAGPQAAGRWVGFQNGFGNLAGIIAPLLTGAAVNQTRHFYSAFLVTLGVALTGSIAWVFIIGPVEPVRWRESGIGRSVRVGSQPGG